MSLGARKRFAILSVLFLLSLLLLIPTHAFAQESDFSTDSLESIVPDEAASDESLEPVSSLGEDAPEVDNNVTSTLQAQVNPTPSIGEIGEQDVGASATPVFDPPYTEVTATEIEDLTEDDWRENLGLPTLVTVEYANAGPDGANAGYPASVRWPIVDWMLEDGSMLSLAYLKGEAAELIDAYLVVYLKPVYSDKAELAVPEWAQIEPVNYLLIVIGNTLSGPSHGGTVSGSDNISIPASSSPGAASAASSSPFLSWMAYDPVGVAYADTISQEESPTSASAPEKDEMRTVPAKVTSNTDKAANAPLKIIKDPTASLISLIIFIVALILLACMKWNTGVLLRVRNHLSSSLKK